MSSTTSTTEELVERANQRHAEAEEKLHVAQQAMKESKRQWEAQRAQLLNESGDLKERLEATESSAAKELLRLKEQLTRSLDEEMVGRQSSEQQLRNAESELRNVLEEAML